MVWWFSFFLGTPYPPLEGRLSWQVEKSNWRIYVAIVGGKFLTFLHVLKKNSSLKCRRQDKLLSNNLESLNLLDSMWASFFCASLHGNDIHLLLFHLDQALSNVWFQFCLCSHGFQLLLLSLSQDVCVK